MAYEALKDELRAKLKAIWNDKDFIVGVVSMVGYSEDKLKKMLAYLDSGEYNSTSDVTLEALYIDLGLA